MTMHPVCATMWNPSKRGWDDFLDENGKPKVYGYADNHEDADKIVLEHFAEISSLSTSFRGGFPPDEGPCWIVQVTRV